jgi:hypothetical protein
MTREEEEEEREDYDFTLPPYPPAEMTPEEFELWIGELYAAATPSVDSLKVTIHERVRGVDGTYDIDATVRYRLFGMDFLVLVEAKRHKNAIKRGLVQELHSKMQSVGAQKGVMFATADFQYGAIAFAATHGIALIRVTEGRFLYETRSALDRTALTPEQARDQWGLPTFAGHLLTPGESPNSVIPILLSTQDPEYIARAILTTPPATE